MSGRLNYFEDLGNSVNLELELKHKGIIDRLATILIVMKYRVVN